MPGLIRKLAIFAAADGLILQPAHQHQRSTHSLHIEYETKRITKGNRQASRDDVYIDSHGIVGLLTVPPLSYLITISGRRQVAQIRGFPVYVITEVALLSLASQHEAQRSLLQIEESKRRPAEYEATASDSEISNSEDSLSVKTIASNEEHASTVTNSLADGVPSERRAEALRRSSSNIAQDVIGKRGQYGRFAERWFSKKGWTVERRRALGMSIDDQQGPSENGTTIDRTESQDVSNTQLKNLNEAGQSKTNGEVPIDTVTHGLANAYTLLPKLLRTTCLLLSSESFFFSYDLDITRRLGTQQSVQTEAPLHESVDRLFFWNEWLTRPFVNEGHGVFILPVMQGFVGQRAFRLTKKPGITTEFFAAGEDAEKERTDESSIESADQGDSQFLLTLISRRSVKRPGLRYLRRGVDEEGHAANSVETEQIFSRVSWLKDKKYSFTQLRGSIPLFFTQSPYSFKPVPALQHSKVINQAAFKLHFQTVADRYGEVQIVLLVDKSGGEKAIGDRYQAFVHQVNQENGINSHPLGFEWFDFHNVCRGMKFENVDVLTKTLGLDMPAFGYTVEAGGHIKSRQQGVARTNCMDCLDRTNVVQSAFGQRALEQQLQKEGFDIDLRTDRSTQWFNTLWADNGDAISKQYSSTAALKGDYTRTRQRNYRGAINDLGLTLSRYYNNTVNDYFSQAAIDYLLGNVTPQVFEDFEEHMMSRDPSISVETLRETAISISSKIVIENSAEKLIGGWTLLSPREANTVRTVPLEESVLLLTEAALYKVCFDWSSEAVSSFERVDLHSIAGIMKGTYITSTLTSAQSDEARNVGFVVKYRPGRDDVTRVNTRSLSSAVGPNDSHIKPDPDVQNRAHRPGNTKDGNPLKILAFKALSTRSSFAKEGQEAEMVDEKQLISNVSDEIKRAVLRETSDQATYFVEDEDIVSLKDAQKHTGLVERWGYSLKRMVWG